MKNKDFFYLQYNKINWKNQEKTKINSFINDYIIHNIISSHPGEEISIFDIGFGIGFFIKMLAGSIGGKYKRITIEGCEPSRLNYKYFLKKGHEVDLQKIALKVYEETFQGVQTKTKFNFITAIYVFPHFLSDELETVVKKINSMLRTNGKFILVLADEKYLENKLVTEQDLFIERGKVTYNGKEYKEILHYSDIPKIGKVVDYNREEAYYLDLFANNNFALNQKESLDDNGFICALYVFEKS